jgi:ferredoxin
MRTTCQNRNVNSNGNIFSRRKESLRDDARAGAAIESTFPAEYRKFDSGCTNLRYNPAMPPATGATKAVGMVPDEMKWEPKSKGLSTPRKKKPKELAVITECCTGCAGSPACVEYCPVEDCMFWVPDEDNPPFGRIQIDPILCIGCKKCLSKGPDGCFLDGCPWDAIVMVDTVEVEKEVGPMAI